MKQIKDHKIFVSLVVLLILMVLVVFLFPKTIQFLFIPKDHAIDIAIEKCSGLVMDQSFDARAYVDRYGNARTMHVVVEPGNNWLPVWIVEIDANWMRSGGPIAEPDDPPVTLAVYGRCIVVVNALTGEVLLADVPPQIE
jgi:hypothetical protein